MAPVVATALADVPTDTASLSDADPIFAAVEAVKRAFDASVQASADLNEAEDRAEEIYGMRPDTVIQWGNVFISQDSEADARRITGILAEPAPGEDSLQVERKLEAKTRMLAAIDEAKAWDKRTGVAPLRERNGRLKKAYAAACSRLAATEPTTPAGAGTLVAHIVADSANGAKLRKWHMAALKTAAEALTGMPFS